VNGWQPNDELSARLVKALSVAAHELSAVSSSQEQVLTLIVSGAVHTVPGADHAGVSLLGARGRLTSQAASSDFVRRIDDLQAAHQEGPCVTALREEHTVLVDDLAAEARRRPSRSGSPGWNSEHRSVD